VKKISKIIESRKESGIILRPEQLVETGYLRFDKIINKQYDLAALLKLAGIPDNGRKNVLFAPTWKWGGGTLMSHYKVFCDMIPQQYNLIIRNHINDTRNIQTVIDYCHEKNIEMFILSMIQTRTRPIISVCDRLFPTLPC
jgi:CDP-glycerol glycerophosphotransferase (TagB/SpsB family)